ncbi:glycyl aminopeptidase [Mizugakiibacter sediminis]|uniref:Glycyl aminopeptidase n=1 Tax=Mizugakiibacter sediminis TaxID=1475481 RepID=A0A0K8QK37_9GAMM|nr:M61 family metallopeptidase [Mizugakiibacter sediminis]GAP65208.1 glycyl aminopeptidase [Mizugakiibacter sediminis]
MNASPHRVLLAAVLCAAACAGAPRARAAVPAPADTPYPGTLKLAVDASDVARRIFRVREEIPVQPGPLTLLYPQWIPGNHSPTGPLDKFAGLVVSADGKPLPWTRDPLDVYAFHVDVPQGVGTLAVEFQYLSPQDRSQGRVVMTPDMLNLQWNAVALYPAGHDARLITVAPSVTLPEGWQFGTALEVASRNGASTTFKPVPFATLIDSPMFAGRHFKRVDLDPGAQVPVHLDIVADAPEALAIKPDQLAIHRALVRQAYKLFGARHYDHYDFLLALSDNLSGIGLEHHRSSENGVGPGYFTDWAKSAPERDLLAHEYTHSWNGKFRRPADLATPNFNVPMQDSLLWVYEGQTQYWGYVLAARSGLWTAEQTRDALASVAATYADNRPGFDWRNVQDTTNDPIIAMRRPLPFRNYQMSEDYYSAGQLIWLAVDTELRELTRDKRSLDDFARAFFGVDDGVWTVKTYTFDDVVATLDALAPHDWAGFLRQRLDAHAPPLDGLARAGWKLVYTDKPSAMTQGYETERKVADFTYSLGIVVANKDGKLVDVRWDGPAFKAGVPSGATLVAVDGREYKAERLKDAITAAKTGQAPIELLIKSADSYRTVRVDYHDGLKYPHLERIPGAPDRLSAILAPRR